ncbi:hypothetical protein ACFSCX_00250 [Bacillus salitolerans]|uniref:RelA/SpoT domain-containing protein n=1 Tax=Bacillus salitolerans TaxID=1437434 RepID=A0ABW4LKI8_9BACI
MSVKEWLEELERDRSNLESFGVKLCDKIKDLYKENNIKIIVTYRIKGKDSLSEKIKRHNVDNEHNNGLSIYDLFNDIIGIRIICMKIKDESKVYSILKDFKAESEIHNIIFNDNINSQPTNQKNGHAIFKIDGYLTEDSDKRIPFELQIKSLANLFWGEMEHLLFYKNSKVLISSKYYEKEINSIYEELKNIDNKLTYMEEAMMSESDEDLLQEKIEVFKRYAYLHLKETLKVEFGNYLNNKYIFNAVGDYIFRTNVTIIVNENRVAKEANEILRKVLYVLLDSKRNELDLSKYIFNSITDVKLDSEIRDLLTEIISERENGWWIYIVLCGVFSYYQGNVDLTESDEYDKVNEHIDECIKNLCNTIHKEINLFTKLLEKDSEKFNRNEIKELTSELVKRFLQTCKVNKNLKFTEKKYAQHYNEYGTRLIRELDAKNLGIIEHLYNNDAFIKSITSILINTDDMDNKISSHVKSLDNVVYETLDIHLEDIDNYLKANNDITVRTFFKLLEGGEEDGK